MKRLPALLGLILLAGCVERELRIESDPTGAEVYLDGERVGTTPYAAPFTFYGTRQITLRLDGRAVAQEVYPIRPPWFQIIPLDLFFELIWPGTLRDDRLVKIPLQPLVEEDPNVLLERAKQWRAEASRKPGSK
ncbi:MAG: PEGA domain-containing protein [Planctomycetes bacterium]|nr:PEGA domain-containing protein [Planctomycetota bacterium]